MKTGLGDTRRDQGRAFRAAVIEIYRKGKIAEAFQAFKKIYLEIIGEVIDHVKGQATGESSRRIR